jgi:hypothetical protein
MDTELLKKYFIYDESSPTCLVKIGEWKNSKHMPAGTLNKSGINQYVVSLPTSVTKKNKGYIVLAKVVYAITTGDVPDRYTVIHIDGNRLNCKKENLKLVSHGEACADKRNRTSAYEAGLRYIDQEGHTAWVGTNKLSNGKAVSKSFGTQKYGYTEAKQMARAFRDGSVATNILLNKEKQ